MYLCYGFCFEYFPTKTRTCQRVREKQILAEIRLLAVYTCKAHKVDLQSRASLKINASISLFISLADNEFVVLVQLKRTAPCLT